MATSTNAVSTNAPKPNAPKPNTNAAPKPNAPKPNTNAAPKPNAPKPNAPKTNTNAAPKPNAPSDVSDNPVPVVRKPLQLDQKVTVEQDGKKLPATITGFQVTYDDKSFLFPTAVLTGDSTIEVAQAGAGRKRRRNTKRTNRKRRSSRRN
jgi:hypothetical protein